jgi:DNA-binding transcriptional regulator GbsR (MarR family)
MDKYLRENQISFLQKIKPFLLRSHYIPVTLNNKEDAPSNLSIRTDDRLSEIIKRLEKLEKMTRLEEQEDGFRKNKIKNRILSILQEKKRLTSSQMSEILGLSRTRCSEYFRELMFEGKVESMLVDRQKFYKLVKT